MSMLSLLTPLGPPMCPRCGSKEITRGGLLSRSGVCKYDILTDTTGSSRCKFCDHRAPTCAFYPARHRAASASE